MEVQMTDVEGPGVVEAVARLETLRNQIGAIEVTASFETKHGDIEIEVSPGGFQMYVNGRPVPRLAS